MIPIVLKYPCNEFLTLKQYKNKINSEVASDLKLTGKISEEKQRSRVRAALLRKQAGVNKTEENSQSPW